MAIREAVEWRVGVPWLCRPDVGGVPVRGKGLIAMRSTSPTEAICVELPGKLLCLFNAEVERTEDGYAVTVPQREIDTGSIEPGEVYRVALVAREEGRGGASGGTGSAPSKPQPPVEEGEIRYVEIEDLGKQGDGIARVERGYVIIVPGAEVGERVKIEVAEVKPNFAVGEVIDDAFD